jgi:hypothetical protein
VIAENAMRQWEYHKIASNDLPRKTDDVDLLNDFGQSGWELVHITSNMVA